MEVITYGPFRTVPSMGGGAGRLRVFLGRYNQAQALNPCWPTKDGPHRLTYPHPHPTSHPSPSLHPEPAQSLSGLYPAHLLGLPHPGQEGTKLQRLHKESSAHRLVVGLRTVGVGQAGST